MIFAMCSALMNEILPQKVCLLRAGVQARGARYGFSAIDGIEWVYHKLSSQFVSTP